MAHNPFMGLPPGLVEDLLGVLDNWNVGTPGSDEAYLRAQVRFAHNENCRNFILGGLAKELREATKRAVDSIMLLGGLSYNEASEVVRDAIKDHVTELSNQIFARTVW